MMDTMMTIVISLVTAVIGWFSSKAMTRREKRASDQQYIASMVEQVRLLVEQNRDLLEKYVAEQDKNLQLINERSEMLEKIESLEREVKSLKNTLNKYIKHEKDEKTK